MHSHARSTKRWTLRLNVEAPLPSNTFLQPPLPTSAADSDNYPTLGGAAAAEAGRFGPGCAADGDTLGAWRPLVDPAVLPLAWGGARAQQVCDCLADKMGAAGRGQGEWRGARVGERGRQGGVGRQDHALEQTNSRMESTYLRVLAGEAPEASSRMHP
jgi:hypothetical protein